MVDERDDKRDEDLDRVLADGLSVPESSEEKVMQGLSVALREEEGAGNRSRVERRDSWSLLVAASILVAMGAAVFFLLQEREPRSSTVGRKGGIQETGDEGEGPKRSDRIFESGLRLIVDVRAPDGDWEEIGKTPTLDMRGVRIPDGAPWLVVPNDSRYLTDPPLIKRFVEEVKRQSIPGLDLAQFKVDAQPVLEALRDFPVLESLKVAPSGKDAVAALARLKGLKRLELSLSPRDAERLSALRTLKALRELRLTVSAFPEKALRDVGELTGLRSLILDGMNITDQTVRHLRKMENLKVLDLPQTKLTDEGVAHLKGLKLSFFRLDALTTVRADGTRITIPSFVAESLPERKPASVPASLAAEEKREVEALIRELDNESFEVRRTAERALVARLDGKTKRHLESRLAQLQKGGSERLQLIEGLRTAIRYIQNQERAQRSNRIRKELERAVEEAPGHYRPPDRIVSARLGRRISFEYIEKPMGEAFEEVCAHCGVTYVFFPAYLREDVESMRLSLKVSRMEAARALNWICRMVDVKYIIRNDVLVVCRMETYRKLTLQGKTIVLPVAPDENPWTLEETARLANEGLVKGEVKAPGKIMVNGDRDGLKAVEGFIARFAAPRAPGRVGPAEWVSAIERALDKTASELPQEATVENWLVLLRNASNINVVFDTRSMEAGLMQRRVRIEPGRRTFRDVVRKICSASGYAVTLCQGALYFTQRRSELTPKTYQTIVDLRPVLKAGAARQRLHDALETLQKSAPWKPPESSFFLRGRWIAEMDAWTERRALAFLNDAAKSAKIPPLPPPPWFAATHTAKTDRLEEQANAKELAAQTKRERDALQMLELARKCSRTDPDAIQEGLMLCYSAMKLAPNAKSMLAARALADELNADKAKLEKDPQKALEKEAQIKLTRARKYYDAGGPSLQVSVSLLKKILRDYSKTKVAKKAGELLKKAEERKNRHESLMIINDRLLHKAESFRRAGDYRGAINAIKNDKEYQKNKEELKEVSAKLKKWKRLSEGK